ncbi:hypothetical protein [Allorhizobium borbori]|uniref:Uncharacterized protein n=1 Tax=Allorhizobium borbori TaxID=485907 RepID=A0A7W6K227_9HYPH|nr:hypothetical protein [Allorhizobium borbori]MBB4103788.1 hypothetical protein [Allorhizobium borbori]
MFKSSSPSQSFEHRVLLAATVALGLCLSAAGALAQQYPNLEVTPDRRGGATGQYGGQNFQVERDYSRPQSQPGSQRRNPVIVVPPQQKRTGGTTQSRCYTDERGQSTCY